MFKDLFSNRLFIGALAFFMLCVGGSLLYSWQVVGEGERELAETQKQVKDWEARQQRNTDNTWKPATQALNEWKPATQALNETQESTTRGADTRQETAAQAEPETPKMSRFGLGPYPEIPKDSDYPRNYFETCEDIETELLRRVHVKMYNEGILDKYSSVGISYRTRLITPIEYGSILVEYETDENGDQRIVKTKGHPDLLPPGRIYTHASEIPSHIKIVTAEEVRFDPYEYLGL